MSVPLHILLGIAVLCCATSALKASDSAAEAPIIVQTSLGRIRGSVLQSRLGVPFYAFRGIRYAKAPLAEHRFRVAEPVDGWPRDEVLDATADGPMCMQYWTDYAEVSEDCLRLNVYTHSVSGFSGTNLC